MTIRPLDIERLKKDFQAAKPFPHLAIDGFLEEAFAAEIAAAYPSFEEADAIGLQFNAVNENRKVQITEFEKFPDPVQRLSDLLSSESLRRDLAEITGIEDLLWDPSHSGGGMHVTGPRGNLDVHIDFNQHEHTGLHRRLNLLVYLNPDWKRDWGGAVEIWDENVKECHGAFAPVFNRAVMFATSAISWHGVEAVKCPPGRTRNSFAVYYYTENVPPTFKGAHTTIFRARPDEYVKKYLLMPAQKAKEVLNEGRHKVRRAKEKLTGR